MDVRVNEVPARLSFGAGADAVAITIRQVSLRAFGPAEAPMIDASASIEKITSPQAELTGIKAKLHSDGFDLGNRSGPLTLSATAESGGSVDETIAGLLAGALKAGYRRDNARRTASTSTTAGSPATR